jgi:Rrf2 family transcriptional regulator, nitric oxide-sensitive transcriptional repressor
MRLTLYSDYALRVLMYAATFSNRLVSTGEISDAWGISPNHLAKVVNKLGRSGYLSIRRGRNGGFKLARKPEEISVGAVVRATEADFRLVECFDMTTNTCCIAPVCGLNGALRDAEKAFMTVLDARTLADIMGGPAVLRRYRELLGGVEQPV